MRCKENIDEKLNVQIDKRCRNDEAIQGTFAAKSRERCADENDRSSHIITHITHVPFYYSLGIQIGWQAGCLTSNVLLCVLV